MTSKRLYRSRDNQMVAGVCAGIAEYLNIDPTLVRLAFLFLAIWGGGGVLAYLIAWIIIPEEPLDVAGPMTPPTPAETVSADVESAQESSESPAGE